MRTQALKWWNGLRETQQENYIQQWKTLTKSYKGDWEPVMISKSSSCIELLYSEIMQYESTLDDSEG